MGLLNSAFPLSFGRTQALLDPLLGVEISRGAIAAANELLGGAFAGTVVSDRFSACNHPLINKRQLCWAHLIRDLSAMAERSGVSGEIGHTLLALQRQLHRCAETSSYEHWRQWRDGRLPWLHQLQQAVDLGCE